MRPRRRARRRRCCSCRASVQALVRLRAPVRPALVACFSRLRRRWLAFPLALCLPLAFLRVQSPLALASGAVFAGLLVVCFAAACLLCEWWRIVTYCHRRCTVGEMQPKCQQRPRRRAHLAVRPCRDTGSRLHVTCQRTRACKRKGSRPTAQRASRLNEKRLQPSYVRSV